MKKNFFKKNYCWIILSALGLTIAGVGLAAGGTEIAQPQIFPLQTKELPVENILIAVGDIMPGRTVEQKMINKNSWTYPVQQTWQITSSGDITFGNLEAPLIKGPLVPAHGMSFRASPNFIQGLKKGGFDVLSLANNHIKNKGAEGIASTINYLDRAGIKYVGAGKNKQQAHQPAIINSKGVTFGFLAYVDSTFTPNSYEAGNNSAGTAFMDKNSLIEDINKLKNKTDIIIISMHAGVEYASQPNQKQINFAHTAIDSGATLVIGHHPHVLEPIEKYKQGYIIYSLGNFIFDQMWSEKTRQSAIIRISFKNNGIEKLDIVPIKIFDFCQPRTIQEDNLKDSIISFMLHG